MSLFAQFGQWISSSNEITLHAIDATMTHWYTEMGPAMRRRRPPEPAGGDTKANRLRWFKEGLAKLAAEGFRRVAFPHEIGCALAGGAGASTKRRSPTTARRTRGSRS